MGRGNVCTSGPYEGLFYIDNEDLHWFRSIHEDTSDEPELRLSRDLSYQEMIGSDWVFDDLETEQYWNGVLQTFIASMRSRYKSLHICDEWISRTEYAILKNRLFYIVVEDNEWGEAVKLIQKEGSYQDLFGLQKRHYQCYLDGIRDALFEQFNTLGIYGGPWTHGVIQRSDSNKEGHAA